MTAADNPCPQASAIGTTADDGTGDTLRAAINRLNQANGNLYRLAVGGISILNLTPASAVGSGSAVTTVTVAGNFGTPTSPRVNVGGVDMTTTYIGPTSITFDHTAGTLVVGVYDVMYIDDDNPDNTTTLPRAFTVTP